MESMSMLDRTRIRLKHEDLLDKLAKQFFYLKSNNSMHT